MNLIETNPEVSFFYLNGRGFELDNDKSLIFDPNPVINQSEDIVFDDKNDFVDFLERLIEHDFAEMALTYLENALSIYPSDKLLRKLLKQLAKGKTIEN
mgnify:CR=1 FL=1